MTTKTFAQVDKQGNVTCVCHFEVGADAIEDGFVDPTGTVTFRTVPVGEDYAQIVERWKWDNGWKQVAPRPSPLHNWSNQTKGWEFDFERAWNDVKRERNTRLGGTDWTQLPDVPEETRSRYKEYRQALRDITKQFDPTAIEWPEPPK